MKTLRHLLVLTLCGIPALAPAAVQAQAHRIVDNLKMFSEEAEAKANRRIAELERVEHKDLVIETLNPPKQPAGLNVKDHEAVAKFFDEYSLERFKTLGVDGVYIMLMKRPEHILRVDIGNNTRTKGYFTDTDRIGLIKILKEGLEKDPDGTLVRAVNYVVDTMEKNHPGKGTGVGVGQGHGGPDAGRGSGGFPWGTVLTIGAVILGIWVLFAVVRALFASAGGGMGGGGGMAPGYGPGYGGGGGFMQNFLGGMLGAAAGMWAYNSFFGHGTSSAFGAGPSDAGAGPLGDTSPDTSASVGGDSWGTNAGGDAGGGDWGGDAGGGAGGGDAGGGDWGGADAGGGGDWGGGDAGGGDWGGGGGDMGGGGGGDW